MFGRKRTATIDGTADARDAAGVVGRRAGAHGEDRPRHEVDTAKPFDAYGLDSRAAVQVSGALEKVVERRLSPGILFDHETIDDLADHLMR